MMHVWAGRAYLLCMLWTVATSSLIRNEGLPLGTLVSSLLVLSGLYPRLSVDQIGGGSGVAVTVGEKPAAVAVVGVGSNSYCMKKKQNTKEKEL